jgi:hypothetical protein
MIVKIMNLLQMVEKKLEEMNLVLAAQVKSTNSVMER